MDFANGIHHSNLVAGFRVKVEGFTVFPKTYEIDVIVFVQIELGFDHLLRVSHIAEFVHELVCQGFLGIGGKQIVSNEVECVGINVARSGNVFRDTSPQRVY